MVIEFDFAWLDLQGRGAKGSTLTAHKVDRVVNAPKENGDDETDYSSKKDQSSKVSKPEKKTPTAQTVKKDSKPALAKDIKDHPEKNDTKDLKKPNYLRILRKIT